MLSMLKNVADFVTPVLTESHFAEKGVLTPEEFVRAGDQLVYACRTWAWAPAPKGSAKSYLPEDKQFLITRNVPSLRRAHTYALADAKEELLRDDGLAAGDEWLSTHSQADVESNRHVADIDVQQLEQLAITGNKPNKADSEGIADLDDLDAPAPPAQPTAATSAAPSAAEDFPDMEAFDDDDNVLPPSSSSAAAAAQSAAASASPATASTQPAASGPKFGNGGYLRAEEPEDNIVKTRTYDLTIVYDKFYRTPRIYLFGYDEHRQPLTAEQIMEDISADHAHKTVTVDPHPYLGVPHASIHPCKHAHVMKRIVDQMASGPESKSVNVDQYMFLFLKFISSVIPTIEYDFTRAA